MDFEDLFKQPSRRKKRLGYGRPYHDTHGRYEHSDHSDGSDPLEFLLGSILRRRSVRIVLAIVLVGALLVGIALVAVLWPVVSGGANYVSENGIRSIAHPIFSFLRQLWEGKGPPPAEAPDPNAAKPMTQQIGYAGQHPFRIA